MPNLARGIAQHLAAQLAALTYSEVDSSGNVFVDLLPSEPDNAVAVFNTGGAEADSKLPYDAPEVMILVRGTADSQWAVDTASAIYADLHGRGHTVLPGGVYLVWALAQSSGPNRTGADANGRPSYSTIYRTEILNPTAARESL